MTSAQKEDALNSASNKRTTPRAASKSGGSPHMQFANSMRSTYADEFSSIASSRRSPLGGVTTLPARALVRKPSACKLDSPRNDGFLPHLSDRTASKTNLHVHDKTPCSLPSTRSTRSSECDSSGQATEVLARLRASAIDRQRELECRHTASSTASKTTRLAAAQAGLLPLSVGRSGQLLTDGTPQSTSPTSSHSSLSSPKLRSPKLEANRPSFLLGGTGSLAQRRRLLQPSALVITSEYQKGIRKLEEGEKIFDLYYWEEVLQEEGDGGKVVVCTPKSSPKDGGFGYVMKIRSKESLRKAAHEEEFVRSQLRMLNFNPHPGVMHVREMLEDDQFYYIVMDKAKGGTFFHSLLKEYKDGVMPQRAVRNLTREILEAVAHLHREGILHRDIKPDNLVMQLHDDPASPGGKVKKVTLIDFDHADTEYSPVSPSRKRHCYGTARFNPPEAFLGDYSASSDLYSVGTILYLLLTGAMPYPDEFFEMSDNEPRSPAHNTRWMHGVYGQMKAFQVDWNAGPLGENVVCRAFCQKLMAFDAVQRFANAEEALEHEWFQ